AAHEGDSYEFMSVWDRCITRGVPGGMFPAGYNNAYQIVQTPGYVMIHYEMIHEPRIIPIDGRAHLPSRVRSWNGDPRGRWEGNTLIVDTTNYNSKGWIATSAAAGRIKGVPQTESLHVVERFTPIDANTITYEATIDDPAMFTRPWTVSIPLHRDRAYTIYEYACHEGNRAVEGVLRGARAGETGKKPAFRRLQHLKPPNAFCQIGLSCLQPQHGTALTFATWKRDILIGSPLRPTGMALAQPRAVTFQLSATFCSGYARGQRQRPERARTRE